MKKSSKQPEPKRSQPGGRTTAPAAEAHSEPVTRRDQLPLFEEATRLFHAGEFEKAREKFRAAAQGTNREISHTAELHARMCDQRLARLTPALNSPEDHYNYAIALINRRELPAAERHLKTALGDLVDADYIHYALALCRALQGDLEDSYVHLKRAIELQPRNRSLARSDPDFHDSCRQAPLRDLVYPERSPSA